jgi:hypothetical protein
MASESQIMRHEGKGTEALGTLGFAIGEQTDTDFAAERAGTAVVPATLMICSQHIMAFAIKVTEYLMKVFPR